MSSIPLTLHKKLIDFFISLPNIHDSKSQRALISNAALDSQLNSQIFFNEPPIHFFSLLISSSLAYGRLHDGRHPLEAVLEATKNYIGQDKREYCETLIQELRVFTNEDPDNAKLEPVLMFAGSDSNEFSQHSKSSRHHQTKNKRMKMLLIVGIGFMVTFIGFIIWRELLPLSVIPNSDVRIPSNPTPLLNPKFRVTYFNLRGDAIDFVLKGKINERWEKLLAGQPYIVPNTVFRDISYLLENFSGNRQGTVLEISVDAKESFEHYDSLGDFPPEQIDKLLSGSFWGGVYKPWRFFNLTNETAKSIISAIKTDRNWNINWDTSLDTRFFERDNGNIDVAALDFWKFFKREDLSEFFQHKTDDKVIEFYKYITQDYFPPDFMILNFGYEHEGCGDGFYLLLAMRSIGLRIALLENISSSPIKIGTFFTKENVETRLRERKEDQVSLEKQALNEKILFPQEMLLPEEKLLIPLEIYFSYAPEEIDVLARQSHTKPPDELNPLNKIPFISFMPSLEPFNKELFKMKTSIFLDRVFNSNKDRLGEKEFIWGSSVSIQQIEIDGITYPFREYSAKSLVIHSGTETGSCPHIYTFSVERKIWIDEGHILYGRNTKYKEGTDEIKLNNFTGQVIIRELDHEISFIDEIYIKMKDSNSHEYKIFPQNDKLRFNDGNYIILHQGDNIKVDFKIPPALSKGEFYLVSSGYYIQFQ